MKFKVETGNTLYDKTIYGTNIRVNKSGVISILQGTKTVAVFPVGVTVYAIESVTGDVGEDDFDVKASDLENMMPQ